MGPGPRSACEMESPSRIGGELAMRLTPVIVGALLFTAFWVHPAAGLTKEWVGVWILYGSHDAPQLASRATSVELFLSHENGTVYRSNSGPLGITGVAIPPGIIRRCQVWTEGRFLASWPCNIPVGEEALARVSTPASPSTPTPPDSSPAWVVSVPRPESKGQYNVFSGQGGEYRALSDDLAHWWISQRERLEAEFAHQRHLKFLGASPLMPILGAIPRAPEISDMMLIHFFLTPGFDADANAADGG